MDKKHIEMIQAASKEVEAAFDKYQETLDYISDYYEHEEEPPSAGLFMSMAVPEIEDEEVYRGVNAMCGYAIPVGDTLSEHKSLEPGEPLRHILLNNFLSDY
jgi:hypothetical protein